MRNAAYGKPRITYYLNNTLFLDKDETASVSSYKLQPENQSSKNTINLESDCVKDKFSTQGITRWKVIDFGTGIFYFWAIKRNRSALKFSNFWNSMNFLTLDDKFRRISAFLLLRFCLPVCQRVTLTLEIGRHVLEAFFMLMTWTTVLRCKLILILA